MRYRLLGRSGLRVSELALGTMTFGTDWGWGADEAECRRIVERFAEAGGNFIDTANNYTDGSSERIVGELDARRPRAVGARDEVHADRRPRPTRTRAATTARASSARSSRACGASDRLHRPALAPHARRDDADRGVRARARRPGAARQGALRRHLGLAGVGRLARERDRRAARLDAVRRSPGALQPRLPRPRARAAADGGGARAHRDAVGRARRRRAHRAAGRVAALARGRRLGANGGGRRRLAGGGRRGGLHARAGRDRLAPRPGRAPSSCRSSACARRSSSRTTSVRSTSTSRTSSARGSTRPGAPSLGFPRSFLESDGVRDLIYGDSWKLLYSGRARARDEAAAR